MTGPRAVAELKALIARARDETGTWRAAGMDEKYLESYSTLQALEAELAARLARIDTEGEPGDPDERSALMASLSIATDGRRFYYATYQYDLLQDAVNYARLQQSRVGGGLAVDAPSPVQVEPPDMADRATMLEFGIVFELGRYRLDEHRYDRLRDAVAYARLRRTHRPAGA